MQLGVFWINHIVLWCPACRSATTDERGATDLHERSRVAPHPDGAYEELASIEAGRPFVCSNDECGVTFALPDIPWRGRDRATGTPADSGHPHTLPG
jgi:hypothetical protein